MLAEKYEELFTYLRSLAVRARVYPERQEDVIHNAIARLLDEHARSPFPSARELWGRATNVMREEIATSFADSMPVSGVSRQAHHYARKYLSQNEQDPHRAYVNQNETPRVSLDLLRVVAGGTGQTDPATLSNLSVFAADEPESSLSTRRSSAVWEAVRALPEDQRRVVEEHMGLLGGPKSLIQVSEDLGIPAQTVKSLWRKAKRQLKDALDGVYD